jgi:Cu2+-exporting ATPase
LIKDRLALESMRTVDTVLFNKTGTLTKGEPTVTDIHTVDGHQADTVLALAAAAEADSEHPLARAIVGAAKARNLIADAATDFESSPAVGVSARVDGRHIQAGLTCWNANMAESWTLPIPGGRRGRSSCTFWSTAGSSVR